MTTTDLPARGVARYLADRLSGLDLVDGTFVRTTASTDGEYIEVDVTRVNFETDNDQLRILLHLTQPMTTAQPDIDTGETVAAQDSPTNTSAPELPATAVMDEPSGDAA
ncbi:MAG: hypothetical protein ACRDTH_19505 [Pseudonocardiaceae bacterium]